MAQNISEQIDISIIIINFNSYEYTSKLLYSIAKYSSGFSYEIIIIDNNSEDKSGLKLKKDFPSFAYILNDKNIGFAKANNQGLKIAKGEYILFLNNDVIFVENSLNILLKYIKNKNNIFIAPQLLNIDGTVQHSIYSHQNLWLSISTYLFIYKIFSKSKYFNKYYLMNRGINDTIEVENITGAFIMSKKSEIEKLQGFDEGFFFYGEDNDLCKRFRDGGGKIIYFPKTKIIHVKGGTNKSSWFHEKNRILAELRLIKKHFSLSKRILGYIILYVGYFLRSLLLFIAFVFTRKKRYLQDSKLKFRAIFLSFK